MPLMETTIGRLYSDDVGKRVVVVSGGGTFDGTLTELWVSRSKYHFKDRPRVSARITVSQLKTDSTGTRDAEVAALKLDGLPLDYMIQVEQDWVPYDQQAEEPEDA